MAAQMFFDNRTGWRYNWTEKGLRMRSLYTKSKKKARERLAEIVAGTLTPETIREKFLGKDDSPVSPTANNDLLDDVIRKSFAPIPTETEEPNQEPGESVQGDSQPEPETTYQPESPKVRKASYAKLSRDLAAGCTDANIVLLAVTVKMFKKDIELRYPPESSRDVMAEGWKAQLDVWLDDHPPQPWMLIAAGNLACFLAMIQTSSSEPKAEVSQ